MMLVFLVVFISFFKSHIPSLTKINECVVYNYYAYRTTYIKNFGFVVGLEELYCIKRIEREY
jgi:hypothetical protein